MGNRSCRLYDSGNTTRAADGTYLSGAVPIWVTELAQALEASMLVIAGVEPDPTGGATHYYASSMARPPAWANGARQTLKLGHHLSFKDVP